MPPCSDLTPVKVELLTLLTLLLTAGLVEALWRGLPGRKLVLGAERRSNLRALFDRAIEFGPWERSSRLFIGVAEVEQQLLRPFRPDEAEADRKPLHKS